jgi:hypothetical protein
MTGQFRRLMMVTMLTTACGSNAPTAPSLPYPPMQAPSPAPPRGGPFPSTGTPIAAGATVAGIVQVDDPACFPNWDAQARCRQYDLTAASDGLLRASLHWEASRGVYDPELILVSSDGEWVAYDGSWPERRAAIAIRGGLTYRVIVLGYNEAQPFELSVAVEQPRAQSPSP